MKHLNTLINLLCIVIVFSTCRVEDKAAFLKRSLTGNTFSVEENCNWHTSKRIISFVSPTKAQIKQVHFQNVIQPHGLDTVNIGTVGWHITGDTLYIAKSNPLVLLPGSKLDSLSFTQPSNLSCIYEVTFLNREWREDLVARR